MSWNDFTTASLDEPIGGSPWDASPGLRRASAATVGAPAPTGLSHSPNTHDDVASIISSLGAGNPNLFAKANSVFSGTQGAGPVGATGLRSNVMNLDDSAVLSDSGSDLFNSNFKDALSAFSAPVNPGGTNASAILTAGYSKSRLAANWPASVAGVSVSNFKGASLGGSNFLEKFSSVTEKTRELERSLGKLALAEAKGADPLSRLSASQPQSAAVSGRPSFSTAAGAGAAAAGPFGGESRHPSFSEKLDSYMSNNNSPAQSRHLSFSSDVNRPGSEHTSVALDGPETQRASIWNPANATSFFPQQSTAVAAAAAAAAAPFQQGYPQAFQQGFMAPAFAMPPGGGYMQFPMSPYMPFYPQEPPAEPGATTPAKSKDSDSGSSKEAADSPAKGSFFRPGLARPMSPYLMPPPFSPYGVPMAAAPMTSPPTAPAAMTPGSPPAVASAGSTPVSPKGPAGSVGSAKRAARPGSKPKKHVYRSPMLEEFRNNKTGKQYSLRDIVGHGYEFSKDQHGSRFIQQQLANASEEDKEVIFNEVRNYSIDLMTDVFGNYVIQKYFEHGNDTQRHILFVAMKANFNYLSLQMYGCRVVQKCLESAPLEDKLEVVEELKSNILELVKDQNGNHVIQKVIECVPTEKTPFILESLKHQIYHLSTHPYGCRVIQRLLEYSAEPDREYILGELKGYIYYLVQDQFGNYVIQHIIEHGSEEYTEQILKIVIENLVELSKHKFASNAVEKCIVHQSEANRLRVYDALLAKNDKKESPLDESSPLSLMMKDPFANYVVQKMVQLMSGERQTLLVYKIRQYLNMITRSNSAGKHLASIDKLISLTEKYS